jgi:hypothetical protein
LGVGGYLTLRPRLADALRQLADRLGWSQGKVHKIEARRQGITPDDAEAWAIACDDRDRAPELHDLADRSLAETVAFRGALRERLPRQQREAQAIEASPLPNVEIRILPTSARVWWFQPVRLFEERTDDADALAVVETLVGNVTYSDPTDVGRYRQAFARIWEAAIAGEEAIAIVNRLAAALQADPPHAGS